MMRWGLAAGIVALLTTAATADEWKGRVIDIDGVPHVENPATPMQSPLTLEPREMWRIGGESEADEELLGRILEILVDDAGNTYLLDNQLVEVKVFDKDGRCLRTIGREGEGPGEFRIPIGMLMPGRRLAVIQGMPSRIVVFDLEGNALPDLPIPGLGAFGLISQARVCGENLMMERADISMADGKISTEQKVCRVGPDGEILATFSEHTTEVNSASMTLGGASDTPTWEVAPDGTLFLSREYDEYEIEVFGADNRLARVISREYESRKRDPEDIAKIEGQFERARATGVNTEIEVEEWDRDIVHIEVRDGGDLWIVSSRSAQDSRKGGMLGSFEVFDGDGRYVRNIAFAVDYNRDRDSWKVRGNRLYLLKESLNAALSAFAPSSAEYREEDEELRPLEVVCYEFE